MEWVSKGPGGSMEAEVVARMKGGVSSSVGWTLEGMVMMWWAWMKAMRPAKVSWKAVRSLSGAGWMVASSARTSCGVLVGSSSLAMRANSA